MNTKQLVTVQRTGDTKIPAEITLGGYTTPVWLQSEWETGEYAVFVRQNGCGHCCTAMAARLHGIADIDPHREFEMCVGAWGKPEGDRHPFTTAGGIARTLNGLGIPAKALPVPERTEESVRKMAEFIAGTLESGKQVILWSHPGGRPNPFSPGEHYVMAVGFDGTGKIVVANSGTRVTRDGAQLCTAEEIAECLYYGATAKYGIWGNVDHPGCAGLVVVG